MAATPNGDDRERSYDEWELRITGRRRMHDTKLLANLTKRGMTQRTRAQGGRGMAHCHSLAPATMAITVMPSQSAHGAT